MTTFGISTTILGPVHPGERDFERLASHRFPVVELAAGPGRVDVHTGAHVAQLRADAAAAGLEIASVSIPLVDAAAALPVVAELGCRIVVLRTGSCVAHGRTTMPSAVDLAALRRAIEPVAELASTLGLAPAIAFPPALSSEDLVACVESFDGPPVGVCLDTGHAHLTDGVTDAIERLAGYVVTMHLHDNQGRDDSHRPPFSGSIDWPAAMMALEKTGYTGRAILEIAPEPDAAAALARAVGARTRLQAILDDLAQPMVFPE